LLTSQVALPARSQPGSSSPPTAHAGSGAEGLSWGHRPQLQPHSPSTELLPGNSRAPRPQSIPCRTRQADLLPGRADAGAEGAAAPPECSALQSSAFPAKWETCLSDRAASCLCAYRKQLPAEAYITAAVKAEAALPDTAKGIPGPCNRSEGQQGCPNPLCCRFAVGQKYEFQSIRVASGPEQFPDPDPLRSNTVLR